MAHFAQLDENNIVTRVIVISNENCGNLEFPESEPIGISFCKNLFGQDTIWKQTSYNKSFRYNYAGIGCDYNLYYDAFIPPQPTEDATLDLETFMWNIPEEPIEETE